MTRGKVALVALAYACSTNVLAAPPPNSLLSRLSGPASVVVGVNRGVSAERLKSLVEPILKAIPTADKVPPCVVDVYTKIEAAVVAVDAKGSAPAVRVAIHGAGLRSALEACIRELDPNFRVSAEGKVAHYGPANATRLLDILWLDDSTALGGNVEDVAKLAVVKTPLDRDERVKPILARTDTTAALWFGADVKSFAMDATLPLEAPAMAWGKVDGKEFSGIATFSDQAAAAKAASLIQDGIARKGAELGPLATEIHVETQGRELRVTVSYASFLARQFGTSANLPPEAAPVAVIGMLAAIAIPAFQKNAKRAKAVEARMNVKRLADGAAVVYHETRKLPASTPITPPLGTCCHGPSAKCAPDAALWKTAGWKALGFSVDDPHHYSYELKSDATSFTARAYGDLNCDGVYSTYELGATVSADGNLTTSPLSVEKELE